MQELISEIQSAWPPQRFRDVGVVVGLSGGADSTAMLIALSRLVNSTPKPPTGFLIAAHFNHGLRGDESDADKQFSASLAQQLGVRFVSAQSTNPSSDEATMSAQRMQFLTNTAKLHGARYVTLAHSLDDNVETVLHHLMRGTGPAGLCGIGSPRSLDDDLVLVRPMLGISRENIRTALQTIGQTWREDSSNANTHYSRNWIRHELIPLIQTRYPAAVPAIDRAIHGQKSWRSAIDELAESWIDQNLIETSPAKFRRVQCNESTKTSTKTSAKTPAVLIAALQLHWKRSGWPRGAMKREHWQRLAEAFERTNSKQADEIARFDLPGGVQVQIADQYIILNRPN